MPEPQGRLLSKGSSGTERRCSSDFAPFLATDGSVLARVVSDAKHGRHGVPWTD